MGGRGRKIDSEIKKEVLNIINEASEKEVNISKICEYIGISKRTYERWKKKDVLIDKRKGAEKRVANKLSEKERAEVVNICCNEEYRDLNPCEIVPILAEKGSYIASESTIYRILKERGLNKSRNNTKSPNRNNRPDELLATGPNQVWSWDITYLKTDVKGKYYYLYLYMDVWSRVIVGWGIFEEESGEIASMLFKNICNKLNVTGIRLHSDNGAPMKSANMLATLFFLGVIPSFSRPRVSNDNPYSESLFKTLKYTAGYPGYFRKLEDARNWMEKFENWYNYEHRHSMINYVTPMQRHNGEDKNILEIRKETYEKAKMKNPERWSKHCKNWEYKEKVYLNMRKNININNTSKNVC